MKTICPQCGTVCEEAYCYKCGFIFNKEASLNRHPKHISANKVNQNELQAPSMAEQRKINVQKVQQQNYQKIAPPQNYQNIPLHQDAQNITHSFQQKEAYQIAAKKFGKSPLMLIIAIFTSIIMGIATIGTLGNFTVIGTVPSDYTILKVVLVLVLVAAIISEVGTIVGYWSLFGTCAGSGLPKSKLGTDLLGMAEVIQYSLIIAMLASAAFAMIVLYGGTNDIFQDYNKTSNEFLQMMVNLFVVFMIVIVLCMIFATVNVIKKLQCFNSIKMAGIDGVFANKGFIWTAVINFLIAGMILIFLIVMCVAANQFKTIWNSIDTASVILILGVVCVAVFYSLKGILVIRFQAELKAIYAKQKE